LNCTLLSVAWPSQREPRRSSNGVACRYLVVFSVVAVLGGQSAIRLFRSPPWSWAISRVPVKGSCRRAITQGASPPRVGWPS